MSAGEGGGGEDVRMRIARLRDEIGSAAQPDDLPGMILSGNAVRRSEHLEAYSRKQSELVAAYAEYAAHLESLVAAVLEVQSELIDIVRMQTSMIPGKPARKTGAGRGRAAAGRAKKTAKAPAAKARRSRSR